MTTTPMILGSSEPDPIAGLDLFTECQTVFRSLTKADKAIGRLRGVLYDRINKNGSQWRDLLKQIDAGVYSVNDMDSRVQQLQGDLTDIRELLKH